MSLTTLSDIALAIAANAGTNAEAHVQTTYTKVGSLELAKREGPPRVTWVPDGGPIETATQDESTESKSAFRRELRCTLYFLGSDYDEAETEMKACLAAMSRTQPLVCIPKREDHDQTGLTSANRYWIKVPVDVHLPILYETYTLESVDSTALTGTITE